MATYPVRTGTIDETGQTDLGLPISDKVCSWLIQFESASFSGSVTIKGAAADTANTALALAYKNMVTGENSTSAITGNALVLVDGSGVSVQLDCTSVASGSLAYTARPMVG